MIKKRETFWLKKNQEPVLSLFAQDKFFWQMGLVIQEGEKMKYRY